MMVRQILSAQSNAPFGPKAGYGTLGDLLKQMPELQHDVKVVDKQTASVKNYVLRMTRSQDRKSFELSLLPSKGCQTGWIANENNQIYTAQALGCPRQ
jgi:hypothetical protein